MTHSLIEPLEARIAPASFTVSAPTISEGDSGSKTLNISVTNSDASQPAFTLHYATSDGTETDPLDNALAGQDYLATSGTLDFPANTLSKTFSVTILGDINLEKDEKFNVTFTDANDPTTVLATAKATIHDDDVQPTISIDSPSQLEGNDPNNPNLLVFTVKLSAASYQTITANVATSDGTALGSSDYTPTTTTLTFAPGVTSQTFSVPIIGDTTIEGDETVHANLSALSNVTGGTLQGTGTIITDELSVSIANAQLVEGAPGATANMSFLVTLRGATAGQVVTLNYSTLDGTAISTGPNADYQSTSGLLTLTADASGNATQTIMVPVNGDAAFEADEIFNVNLSNVSGGILISHNPGVGTITNDDPSIVINPATLTEGNLGSAAQDMTFNVTVDKFPAGTTLDLHYHTTDGTAVSGGTLFAGTKDYDALADTVLLVTTDANGHGTGTITVKVNGDGVTENNEFFNVVVDSASIHSGAAIPIVPVTGKGTIIDNDTTVLTIGDVTVVEGNSGHKDAVFLVTLTPSSTGSVTVSYLTGDGTATSAGVLADYTPKNGTLTFAPGVTAQTIVVPILGDLVHEGDETFTVTLSNASSGVSIAKNVGTGTIQDDGDPVPTISLAPASVLESKSGGTAQLSFVATLSAPSQSQVTVDFATTDGTATAGSDYTLKTGTITFAPGTTTQTILIDVTDDMVNEADETMSVHLSNPTVATLAVGGDTAIGTILNDDITASIAPKAFKEGDPANTTFMTVTLSDAPVAGSSVTVNFTLNGGTAVLGTDVKLHDPTMTSVTFAAGETTKDIAFDIIDDTLSEGDETFTVKLTSATGGIIAAGNDTGIGTIHDNDAKPTVSINNAQILEGDNGTKDMTFTVTLSAASGQAVTVNAATMDGTAHAVSDYIALSMADPNDATQTLAFQTITFPAGTTSQTVKVKIVGDTIDEGTETFKVVLSSPSGADLGSAEGTGTIFDNDLRAVSIADASVAEGATGDLNHMIFTVSIPTPATLPITVAYDTFDGTAKADILHVPGNYVGTSGTVTIIPGDTFATFTVDVHGNNTAGPEKSFGVKLHDPVNATLADSNAVGTITDDESTYKLVPVTDTSVEDDPLSATPNTVTFKVVRSGDTTLPGTVSYTTVDGTVVDHAAKAGADYVAKSGTLNFAPGETSKLITVTLRKDVALENTETFDLKLTGSTGGVFNDGTAVVPLTLSATATIIDNDTKIPTISILSVSAPEGNPVGAGDPTTTDLTFVVSLSTADETHDVTLTYETIDGTGETGAISTPDPTHPADFTKIAPTTLTIPKGSLSASFVVHVLRDTISEGDETFKVQLSSPTGGETFAPGGDTATGTITNDDALPTVTFDGANNGNLTIVEGNPGSTPPTLTPATFTVKLSAASEQTVTMNVSLATTGTHLATAGTDPAMGADFTTAGVPTMLTFAPGETSKTLDYAVFGDLLNESDETFTVVLSNVDHATFSTGSTLQATATIKNDDPVPALVIGNASVVEGNSGTTNLVFNVTLTGEADHDVTVDYNTLDVGAFSSGPGADYQATSGTLTFHFDPLTNTIQHTQPITVLVNGDTIKEVDETLSVKLSNPTNATIATSLGIGTILDDGDTTVGVSVSDVKVTEGDSATKNASFTVQLSGASTVPVTVDVATRNGTAVAGADYVSQKTTLTFAAGETSKTFTVAIKGDTIFEATESFFVGLSNATGGGQILDTEGRGTIYNDDIQIVNAQTVRFVDTDGDLATVHVTKGVLTTTGQNPVLSFGSVNSIGGRALQMIDFTSNRLAFNHTDLSVTADLQPGFSASGGKSDGRVDVGYIQGGIAEGSLFQIFDNIDFGNIVVEGDLGKIIAGDQIATDRAVLSMNVLSHGAKGTSTGAPDNSSVFLGGAGRIVIGGDCFGLLESVGGDLGDIESLTIKGALRGGSDQGSGQIFVTGTLINATIGSIVGGSGAASGTIIGNFTNDATLSSGSSIGNVHVLGDIVGGAGTNSARIFAPNIGTIVVDGSLKGGTGQSSGVIQSGVSSFGGSLAAVSIKGDVVGGDGANSGEVFAAKNIGSVVVRGSLMGGAGDDSGSIVANASVHSVTVLQNIEGAAGQRSGSVQATKSVTNFQVGSASDDANGNLVGGSGTNSGAFLIGRDVKTAGVIFGNVIGGSGPTSGGLNIGGTLTKLSIRDDLTGGSTTLSGANGGVSSISNSGFIAAVRIGALSIGNDIVSGTKAGPNTTVAGSATIRASGDIGSLVVGGSIVGNSDVPVVIAAGGIGAASNQTIGSLLVKGSTTFADILGGYGGGVSATNPLGNPVNPDAQMGPVRILGSVEATNIVAGVAPGADSHFGTDDDVVISGGLSDNPAIQSRIAAVILKGTIATNADPFGIVAQIIGAATIGTKTLPLDPVKADNLELDHQGSNFHLKELAGA